MASERQVLAGQATAARRRVFFHLVGADGITPATGESGGQPQISTNGGAWSNTGIGALTSIGNGRYYADLTAAAVGNSGDVIQTRYKSANTAECPGDSVRVVAIDLDNGASLGLSNVDAAISSRSTYAGGDTAGTTSLLGRLTVARAGYLDNLNIGGNAASSAEVQAIATSSTRRVTLITVGQFERPESGSVTYQLEVRTYTAAGALVNADMAPTLTATGLVSGSLSGNLSAATNPATGVYRWTYTVASGATVEQIRFDVSALISAASFGASAYTQVADFVASTWTTADRALLTALSADIADGGRTDLILDGIAAKTVNLPSDPADASDIAALFSAAAATQASILAKTNLIPDSPAAVGSAMTLTSGERDAIAAAALDLANGVETGVTMRQALRAMAAGIMGLLSGAEGSTITLKAIGNPGTTRAVVVTDSNNNRLTITLTL